MLCATLQNLSVPLRKSDYLPWDTGLTILAITLMTTRKDLRNIGKLLAQEDSRFTHISSIFIWEVSSVNLTIALLCNHNLPPGADAGWKVGCSLFFTFTILVIWSENLSRLLGGSMITSNVPNTVCADPSGMTLMYGEYANLIRLTFIDSGCEIPGIYM